MTRLATNSEDARQLAHEQMESALQALDALGELTAAIHLDHAIASLGLRTEKRRSAMLHDLTETITDG